MAGLAQVTAKPITMAVASKFFFISASVHVWTDSRYTAHKAQPAAEQAGSQPRTQRTPHSASAQFCADAGAWLQRSPFPESLGRDQLRRSRSGAPHAASATLRLVEFVFNPGTGVAGHHHELRDAVAMFELKSRAARVV